MEWNESCLRALAPDPASIKAAEGLCKPVRWPSLGNNETTLWGECQGSGSKPYQTQIDLSGSDGPSFRCSCPSRKFPCKHGLALMLLRVRQPAAFDQREIPAWVGEWLASRAERAERKAKRDQTSTRARAAGTSVDPDAAARTERQRWSRIDDGIAELRQWLDDRIVLGLGSLDEASIPAWHSLAARMVDAQAPLLAQRVRAAAALIRQDERWPERVLCALGMLQLACDAIARRQSLTNDELADLKSLVIGWPTDKAQVLASQEPVLDRWLVLGQIHQELDGRLSERRVWLHGLSSGRRALILDHALAGKAYDSLWPDRSAVTARLAFYPSASPLRALPVERDGVAAAAGIEEISDSVTDGGEWPQVARRIAACPWTPLHPVLCRQAIVVRVDSGFCAQHEGRSLVLDLCEDDGWTLTALGGGHPLDLTGEWDGHRLRPLHAAHDDGIWLRSAA